MNKLLSTAVIITLILIGGFFVYKPNLFGASVVENANQSQNIDENPPSNEQLQDGNKTKADSQDESTKTNFKASLTSINQTENKLQIRAIANIVSSQGSCELVLIKDSRSITKTSFIQAMPSSSTCVGFDILKTELSAGKWEIKLTVNINDQTSTLEDIVDVTL